MNDDCGMTADPGALALTVGNDLAEFKRITPHVLAFLEAGRMPDSAAYAVRVAVEELVVNVINYAYDDGEPHEIRLEVRREDDCVVVIVEDDGRPFDPTAAEVPDLTGGIERRRAGGWGIHLVRSMSESVTYRRDGGRNRVQVRIPLEKR